MGAVADAGNVLGHPLCITQNSYVAFFFLSANIFRIRFQDWDLSATGVLLFRICKNYCTLITYTDLIHNF